MEERGNEREREEEEGVKRERGKRRGKERASERRKDPELTGLSGGVGSVVLSLFTPADVYVLLCTLNCLPHTHTHTHAL